MDSLFNSYLDFSAKSGSNKLMIVPYRPPIRNTVQASPCSPAMLAASSFVMADTSSSKPSSVTDPSVSKAMDSACAVVKMVRPGCSDPVMVFQGAPASSRVSQSNRALS